MLLSSPIVPCPITATITTMMIMMMSGECKGTPVQGGDVTVRLVSLLFTPLDETAAKVMKNGLSSLRSCFLTLPILTLCPGDNKKTSHE